MGLNPLGGTELKSFFQRFKNCKRDFNKRTLLNNLDTLF